MGIYTAALDLDYLANVICETSGLFEEDFVINEGSIKETIKEKAISILHTIIDKIKEFIAWVTKTVAGFFKKLKDKLVGGHDNLEQEFNKAERNIKALPMHESASLDELREFLQKEVPSPSTVSFLSKSETYFHAVDDIFSRNKPEEIKSFCDTYAANFNVDNKEYKINMYQYIKIDPNLKKVHDGYVDKVNMSVNEAKADLRQAEFRLKEIELNKNNIAREGEIESIQDLLAISTKNSDEDKAERENMVELIKKKVMFLTQYLKFVMKIDAFYVVNHNRCENFLRKANNVNV